MGRFGARKQSLGTYLRARTVPVDGIGSVLALSRRMAHSRARGRRWSAKVMQQSDALDLESGVFARSDPRSIARSLKRSAEQSTRRKADPYRSAMSMLTFFINRAGRGLSAKRRRVLEQAKGELRRLYGR